MNLSAESNRAAATRHRHQTAPTRYVDANGISLRVSDVIVYSINSWMLQQNIPNAQLIFYPEANHGSLYQYPTRFVAHVEQLLSDDESAA